uniref:Uncharacterized protein n=1 Tax=Pinguiococcus pyrenoidosus TaxID=172671 RepID=A0A7R9U6R1_9STRA
MDRKNRESPRSPSHAAQSAPERRPATVGTSFRSLEEKVAELDVTGVLHSTQSKSCQVKELQAKHAQLQARVQEKEAKLRNLRQRCKILAAKRMLDTMEQRHPKPIQPNPSERDLELHLMIKHMKRKEKSLTEQESALAKQAAESEERRVTARQRLESLYPRALQDQADLERELLLLKQKVEDTLQHRRQRKQTAEQEIGASNAAVDVIRKEIEDAVARTEDAREERTSWKLKSSQMDYRCDAIRGGSKKIWEELGKSTDEPNLLATGIFRLRKTNERGYGEGMITVGEVVNGLKLVAPPESHIDFDRAVHEIAGTYGESDQDDSAEAPLDLTYKALTLQECSEIVAEVLPQVLQSM